jgi:hypothetical protein
VSQAKWEEEREELIERLRKAEQIAAEAQSEAAVYWELLEDWYEAAKQAQAQQDFSLLQIINRRIPPFYLPNKDEGKLWGKLFLSACMRDARWLARAKQSLERIRADAENLSPEDSETNMELKRSIIEAVEQGLIIAI